MRSDPWTICDRCGLRYARSETRVEWTGLRVCTRTCFEQRHPQDYVRAMPDRQAVLDPRPETPDKFLAMDRPYTVPAAPVVVGDLRGDTVVSTDPMQYKIIKKGVL